MNQALSLNFYCFVIIISGEFTFLIVWTLIEIYSFVNTHPTKVAIWCKADKSIRNVLIIQVFKLNVWIIPIVPEGELNNFFLFKSLYASMIWSEYVPSTKIILEFEGLVSWEVNCIEWIIYR